jgi:hypothetical protein
MESMSAAALSSENSDKYPASDAARRANAALIVRAVNAHDELVAALKRIALPADAGCGCSYPCRCDAPANEAIRAGVMRDIASEALAKTEAA